MEFALSSDSSSEDDYESECDDLLLCALTAKRRHRFWIDNHIRFRNAHGEFNTLWSTLSEEKFEKYYRLTRPHFNIIHEMIKSRIQKQDTTYRESINSAQRLAIALRYMATGDSFQTIAYNYRVGSTTVSNIVQEVCDAIWITLGPIELEEIKDPQKWKQIDESFKIFCDFPLCVGAIDGKHVTIKAPPNCGSEYFNYLKDNWEDISALISPLIQDLVNQLLEDVSIGDLFPQLYKLSELIGNKTK